MVYYQWRNEKTVKIESLCFARIEGLSDTKKTLHQHYKLCWCLGTST